MDEETWKKYKQMRKEIDDFVDTPSRTLMETCEHKYNGWIDHQLICAERTKTLRSDVGYGFRNHITRGRRKKKNK